MAISLYDVSVGTYLQVLSSTRVVLDKGLLHCHESRIDPERVVETRLWPDMQPFRFQIQQIAIYSGGTIAALKSGNVTRPDPSERPKHNYAGLQELLRETEEALKAITPADVNACESQTIAIKARNMYFSATDYVLTFSLPNVYFHATTAYDILRHTGVPVGKWDFLGKVRTLSPP